MTIEPMKHSLAIVIPYYKGNFFRQTIISLKAQTDQRFRVYIGDDNSPDDIHSILSEFNSDGWISEKIIVTRFSDNLGNKSLVKHWERCIALTNDENWIWLFSDDDKMSPDCVECFYSLLDQEGPVYDLYKFESTVIDQNGQTIRSYKNEFESRINSFDLILYKITGRLHTFAVEYIFSRSIYQQTSGFVDFPLAWGSDDASWVRFSEQKGIRIIPGADVFWRLSTTNISGNISENGFEKMNALLLYGKWIINHFKSHKEIATLKAAMGKFILQQIDGYITVVTPGIFLKIFFSGGDIWGYNLRKLAGFAYHKNKAAQKNKKNSPVK